MKEIRLHKELLFKLARKIPQDCPVCNIRICSYDVSLLEPCKKQINIVRAIKTAILSQEM